MGRTKIKKGEQSGFYIEPEYKQQLKILAADAQTSLSEFVQKLIRLAFEQRDLSKREKRITDELIKETAQHNEKVEQLKEELKKCEKFRVLRDASMEKHKKEALQSLARLIYNRWEPKEIERRAMALSIELGGKWLFEELLEEAYKLKDIPETPFKKPKNTSNIS